MDATALRPARVNPVVTHPEEQRFPLAGGWAFRLDPEDRGVAEQWHVKPQDFTDGIAVPGCWQGQGFGGDGRDRLWDFNIETRVFRATYCGTGWYARRFRAPGGERPAVCPVRLRHHAARPP